jgi:replicative DNA helicase
MSDLERKLLSKLTDSISIAEAWEAGVRMQVFEQPLYQAIWNFSIEYWQQSGKQSAPTLYAITEEFAGYVPVEAAEETTWLADKLRERYLTNQVQEILRTAAKDSVTNPAKALHELYTSAYAACEVVADRRTRVNMADTVEERREAYKLKAASPQGLGVTYGIDLLDILTGGILPGEMAIVGAVAKTGKTMFLLNAACEAIRRGYTPLIFSLELSLKDTQERLDGIFSEVSYNRLVHGHLSDDELLDLYNKQDELTALGGLPIERPEPGDRTPGMLCARARELGADYLIIDQLSFLEAGHKTFSTKELRASVLRQLRNEIGRPGQELPLLMATQGKREGGEEPTMESFADAAEVERDADICMFLYRNMEERNNHRMLLKLVASRRTDITTFLCEWELSEATRIRAEREIRS